MPEPAPSGSGTAPSFRPFPPIGRGFFLYSVRSFHPHPAKVRTKEQNVFVGADLFCPYVLLPKKTGFQTRPGPCSFASNTVLLLTKCKQCFRFKDNKIRNPRALHVFFASIYLHKNTFEA